MDKMAMSINVKLNQVIDSIKNIKDEYSYSEHISVKCV